MLRATLYRHWLELRFLVLATLGPWLALCAMTAFLAVAVPPALSPVHVHAWALSLVVVLAGVVFGGTGIRSGLESAPRSVYYTLTLPVSRFMITWTRLCTAAAIALALVLGVFLVVVAALWSAGQEVPLRALAASMLLALAAAATTQAVGGLLLPLVTERFSPALLSLIPAGVMLAILRTLDDGSTGWVHVVRFLEFQPARWDLIGALLLVIAGSLATAAVLVRVRDF
jgi:hypothetical protein